MDTAREVDMIITTALIPGRQAPILLTKEMVKQMKPGSVIVDLAAEMGGNCELTQPGKVVVENGVSIVGYTDLLSRMAPLSSELYSMNLWYLMEEMGGATEFKVDLDNDIVGKMTVINEGKFTWTPPSIPTAPQVKK
mmetsp:Transcript_29704/g.5352  ORF Transcript_29704/g.5352 Transcript_29704/m.5352 type:complete len:137 (+) Transcript_29704:2205-2615(+)